MDEIARAAKPSDGQSSCDGAGVEAQRPLAVGWMHEDFGAARAADVIGMRVGHDEPRDLPGRAAESADGGVQTRERTAHAGIDDGDVVLEDRVRRRADEWDRVDAGRDLGDVG
ncbi:MAG: hypothetical protein M3Z65_01845 [Chloroflexota bacterium]|nr:hypothetical protein [Chloroflexota bacterium]